MRLNSDFDANAFCGGAAGLVGLFVAGAFYGWNNGQQQQAYDPVHAAEMKRMADDLAVARERMDVINAAIDRAIANPRPPAQTSKARNMREVAAEIAAIRDRYCA